ncbi:hypothetical protein ACPOM7_28195 [Peribacillus castrilensis]|uniref:Uncharacterized protein n=1 Tax=Peribacillus simplex TaxID=1478 RepID=A0AAN2TT68_9BACI|nr:MULTISPECIES: hypothetical protein [Bacillaceae]MCU6600144.1 hypothetical protein [Peribacillus frigoritolerans]MEA3574251.1 hypothetical protein [Peribacillus frigoritolerans]CEG33010.1 hypothetical protein BN1180_03182 [Peribacillus simplex]
MNPVVGLDVAKGKSQVSIFASGLRESPNGVWHRRPWLIIY